MAFTKTFEVRWADLDANFHLRHSAYSDMATQMRMNLMQDKGFDLKKLASLQIAPVIFREETIYLKEILYADKVTIDCQLLKATADGARWSFVQTFYKEGDIKSAVITVEGAWFNIATRKLSPPPAELAEVIGELPRHEQFQEIVK